MIDTEQQILNCSFTDGICFGDRSMLLKTSRAGTCIAAQDTYLAIVTSKNYKRFLKKHAQAKVAITNKFLRQIEFIDKMTIKEVTALQYNLQPM